MNVLLFGATGMIGDGVLHACLSDGRVSSVRAVARSPVGHTHPKLRELRRTDFLDFSDLVPELDSVDACFFCLGVSSAGMSEARYRELTYDITLAAAAAIAEHRPGTVFCYVSGEGADSSTNGRRMWARVKGETENALLALPIQGYMLRPGYVQARSGARSKTPLYRFGYAVMAPLYPLLKRLAPRHVTTSENIGRAMIAVATAGHSGRILENPDINSLAAADPETAAKPPHRMGS